jgi:hypothetical protein
MAGSTSRNGGGPFQGKGLPQVPKPEMFGNLVVGDSGGGQPSGFRGLLDEFFAFRRPLTEEEAQLLWKLNSASGLSNRR